MEVEKDWQLTMCYTCPQCGKHYAVAEWKQNPKCRQCGVQLRADDQQGDHRRQLKAEQINRGHL